jgi:hypothetical protein
VRPTGHFLKESESTHGHNNASRSPKNEFLEITYFRVLQRSPMDAAITLETSRFQWPCCSNTGKRGTGLGTLLCVTQYHQQQIAVNAERLVRAEKYTSSWGMLRTGSAIQFPFSAAYESVWVHQAPNCKEQSITSTFVHRPTLHFIIRGLPDHSCFNARFLLWCLASRRIFCNNKQTVLSMHFWWFQASAAMWIKSAFFWVFMQCTLIFCYWRFGTTYRSHL